ncbi:MAG: hypothetical protein IJU35_08445 [Paludibacteraceae bacterium]|nr:hypothetical protein [Paludibacteraceae bacterium]
MKLTRIILFCCVLSQLVFSVSAAPRRDKNERKEQVKAYLKAHYKPYGYVCNYFIFDSRESVSGQGGMFYYLPRDNNWNQTADEARVSGIGREDLNAKPSFRFLSLTTRGGLDVTGYKWGKTEFGAKIEADFYAGLNGSTGAALLRLRLAYITLAWDSLRVNDKSTARVSLLMGQAWHPLAADLCDVISLNTGMPFGPFSRTPQVKLDATLGEWFTITGAAMWQMQYTSAGPDGQSANYIKYSCTPEGYLGLSFSHKSGVLLRAGVDVLSIAPRNETTIKVGNGEAAADVKVKVKERITTFSPFLYFQYKHGDFSLKAKAVFAEAGEHVNLNGGYGVSKVNGDGSWQYTPTRNLSSWLSITYGKAVKGILFAGYVRNFGTKESLAVNEDGSITGFWFSKNSFSNLNRLWRLSPTVVWNIGMFQLGLEYEITSAQYGDGGISPKNGLAEKNLHWITNHRVQFMTKFSF